LFDEAKIAKMKMMNYINMKIIKIL